MKGINKKPDKVQRRLEIFNMFYPLEKNAKKKWAKVFNSSFAEIVKRFADESITINYEQTQSKNLIFWKDKTNSKVECMFCFINDLTDLNRVYSIFRHIKQHKPFLTYAIVHQKKDGETTYDIFRLSKFSYLEHCNRVN